MKCTAGRSFVFRDISDLLIYNNINWSPLFAWVCTSLCMWTECTFVASPGAMGSFESHSVSLSISLSHEQMPHNAIASQEASATLLPPLAAIRLQETWNFPIFIYKNKKVFNDKWQYRRKEAENRKQEIWGWEYFPIWFCSERKLFLQYFHGLVCADVNFERIFIFYVTF